MEVDIVDVEAGVVLRDEAALRVGDAEPKRVGPVGHLQRAELVKHAAALNPISRSEGLETAQTGVAISELRSGGNRQFKIRRLVRGAQDNAGDADIFERATAAIGREQVRHWRRGTRLNCAKGIGAPKANGGLKTSSGHWVCALANRLTNLLDAPRRMHRANERCETCHVRSRHRSSVRGSVRCAVDFTLEGTEADGGLGDGGDNAVAARPIVAPGGTSAAWRGDVEVHAEVRKVGPLILAVRCCDGDSEINVRGGKSACRAIVISGRVHDDDVAGMRVFDRFLDRAGSSLRAPAIVDDMGAVIDGVTNGFCEAEA